MDRLLKLATGLIRRYPQRAVTILQQQPIPEVVELLDTLPASFSLQLLSISPYSFAAAIIDAMEEEQAIDLLGAMQGQTVANILRLVKSNRQNIVARLPFLLRASVKLLLKFDESTIGAWMSIRFVSVPSDITVEEAMNILLSQNSGVAESSLYAIDSSSRLIGRVHFMTLMGCDKKQLVSSIVIPCHSLPASMSVAHAIESGAWELQDECPVLDHKKNLIGVITHSMLRQTLRNSTSGSSSFDDEANVDILFIFNVYISSLIGLLAPLNKISLSSKEKE